MLRYTMEFYIKKMHNEPEITYPITKWIPLKLFSSVVTSQTVSSRRFNLQQAIIGWHI